jgi:5'-nucleotidase
MTAQRKTFTEKIFTALTSSAMALAATALAMLLFAACGGSSKHAPSGSVVILHTNDTHGRVAGNVTDIIGIDRIAAIHKNTPGSLLIDAGDAFHGLPIATLSKGGDIAALMTAAGYDAMVIGNHEFNYGWERLLELRDLAGFPIFASNVKRGGKVLLDDTRIIEANGIKIGLFGVTTETAEYSVMPEFVRGLSFEAPARTAADKTEYLRSQGAHMVVAICHLGVVELKNGSRSTDLAQRVPGIDVIIDGHSHTELPDGLVENGVLIAQAGQHGSNLGKVSVSLENGRVASKKAELIAFDEARQTAPDEAVSRKLSEIIRGYESKLSEPIGESRDYMSSERNPGVRTMEMPLGNLVADAYREAAAADIAVANGGDIRADLLPGAVRNGDVISILPFGNTLMVKTVTPALLREVLENGVSGIVTDGQGNIDHEQSPQGRFLQVSGFSFCYDPSLPAGERILSITLDGGRQLSLQDETTEISLAGTNYVMTGGDHYTMLAGLPVLRELGAADEALASYIKKHSPVGIPAGNRIIPVSSYKLQVTSFELQVTSLIGTRIIHSF